MPRKTQISEKDIGIALIAWYQKALETYPDGLVSQAQAATMLGISRVGVSRLINRGHLRAVYFPKQPDIEGFHVGSDDPFWLQILTWFDPDTPASAFPKVIYVSFGDIVDLWQAGDVKDKCKINWKVVFSGYDTQDKRYAKQQAAIAQPEQ
jgi:hypothetical protein